jgi:hypothetical protein
VPISFAALGETGRVEVIRGTCGASRWSLNKSRGRDNVWFNPEWFGALEYWPGDSLVLALSEIEDEMLLWGIAPSLTTRIVADDLEVPVRFLPLDRGVAFVGVVESLPQMVVSFDHDDVENARASTQVDEAGFGAEGITLHDFVETDEALTVTGEDEGLHWSFTWDFADDSVPHNALMLRFVPSRENPERGWGSSMGISPASDQPVEITSVGNDETCVEFTGWADRSVTRLELQLATGERLVLPLGGTQSGRMVNAFGIALARHRRAFALDSFDSDNNHVSRVLLRQHLGR